MTDENNNTTTEDTQDDGEPTPITYDILKTFKAPELRKFVGQYKNLKTTMRKDELLATAHAAVLLNLPKKLSKETEDITRKNDYDSLLSDNGFALPDPKSLTSPWAGEKNGMQSWPPINLSDITVFLMKDQPGAAIEDRLLNEYKQGKAYRYYTSEWLKEIFVQDVGLADGISHKYKYLKAACTPSMKIGQGKHQAWVIARDDGHIISAYCTCTAGLIGTCNHVGGILFRIEEAVRLGLCSPACTSLPNTWKIPTAKTKLDPIPAMEMEWKQEKYGKQLHHPMIHPKRRLYQPVHERYHGPDMEKFRRMSQALLPCLPNALMHQAVQDLEEATPRPAQPAPVLPPVVRDLLDRSTKSPVLTDDEVQQIQLLTTEQSTCKLWKDLRCGRITASNFHAIKTCTSTNPESLVNKILGVTGPPEGLSALQYGRNTEEQAREAHKKSLSAHVGLAVSKCGLFLDKDQSYIGASPDGMVCCQCCGQGTLEIKCPYSIADEDPCEKPPKYMLKLANGTFKLKRSHMYYTQVQGQLALSKRAWCDFYVFSKKGSIRERINFDEKFWSDLKPRLTEFYAKHLEKKCTGS